MKFSEIQRKDVVDLETAEVIGFVDDAILDADARLLMGFVLRKTQGKSDWLAWGNIKAIGVDAITVESIGALVDQPEGKGRLLLGDDVIAGRVLTNKGEFLSPLADMDFDSISGHIIEIILNDGKVLAGADLLGSGRFATVIKSSV